MWACARGHLETAVTLYNWNKAPLHVFNSEGHLPLLVARRHGHHQLADHLEQIDKQDKQALSVLTGVDILCRQPSPDIIASTPGLKTVSSSRSTPERTNFVSASPVATSTPVSNDLSVGDTVFKTPHQIPEKGQNHGILHIQIPSDGANAQDIPHPLHSRENFTRRQSDQMLAISSGENSNTSSSKLKQKLKKRLSVDLLPYDGDPEPVHFSPTNAYQRPVREANSEPHLSVYADQLTCELNPMLSGHCANDLSPDGLMQVEGIDSHERQHHGKVGMHDDRSQGEVPVNMDTGRFYFIFLYILL